MDNLREIRFVIGPQGKPTAVLVDITIWEHILNALEYAEDIRLARQTIHEIDNAGGNLDKAGLILWEQARKELEQMDDAQA